MNFPSSRVDIIDIIFIKGTSRGPEALQSPLNDSYYTNVLCWQ